MIVVAGEALIDLVAEADDSYRAVPGGSPAVGVVAAGVSDFDASGVAATPALLGQPQSVNKLASRMIV